MICWGEKVKHIFSSLTIQWGIELASMPKQRKPVVAVFHNKRQSNMFPVFARVITATWLLPTLGNRTKLQNKQDCRVFQKLEWNHLNGFQTQCVLRLVFLLYFVTSTGFCWMKLWNCVCKTLWSLFQPTSLFFPLRNYPSLSDACCSLPSRDFAASLSVFASLFQAHERVDSSALPALSAMGKATKPSKYSMQRQIKFNKH